MARPKKRSKTKKILFAVEIIVFLVFIGGLYVYGQLMSRMDKTNTQKLDTQKVQVNEEVQDAINSEDSHLTGYTTYALFGIDSRSANMKFSGNQNSDTMIIASVNNDTKDVKLVSIYRDTLLELDDGSYNKANSAYSFGGPEGAVSLINRNLDMNIEKYVTVNFNALVDVIDAVGGLDLELTHDEVVHMNNYCVETSKVTGKSYEKIEPEVEGTYHLNGVQAVSYSRIRYTEGGDFKRAERQRLVLQKIADKAQNMSVGTVNKIIDSVFPQISTNFTLAEIIGYAKNLTKYKLGDSIGFPAENTTDMLNEVGSVVIPKTLSSNVLEVHKFLFGSDGYSVSSTIEGIESGITAKASDKAKSGTTIEDDETPGSKGYSENYSNNSSGTGTTRSTYGTTGGSTYGTGYSGGTSTGSGTTGSTGSTSSGTTGTTGGTEGTTTGGGTTGDNAGSTSGTTGSTEGTE